MFATIAAVVVAAATPAPTAPPIHAAPFTPSYVAIVRPGRDRHVPAKVGRPSDVHCYSATTGAALFQHTDRRGGGLYWTDARGRAVVGYVKVNRDFVSFTRSAPVLCAAWTEGR